MAREAPAYTAPHFPLSRTAVCLDCETVMEIGEVVCPACSGSALWTLTRWLDRGGPAARDGGDTNDLG